MSEGIRVKEEKLVDWVARIFEKGKVSREHALVGGEVLVMADVRGIESHGVARLPYYWRKLEK